MKIQDPQNIDFGVYSVPSSKSKDEAWMQLLGKIETDEQSKSKKQFHLSWFFGATAAAAIFLAILYIGMFNTGKYSPIYYSEITETDSVYLPDKSLVVLNSNSSIKYHYDKITGFRSVVLDGHAFFEVEKGRKFQVDCFSGKVTVKGTSFNIINYSKNFFMLECISGEVEVEFENSKVKLQQGEGIKFLDDEITSFQSASEEMVKEQFDGIYQWEKVALKELFLIIAGRFNYDILISSSLENQNFSGKLDLTNLQKGLSIVSYAMNLSFEVHEETKTITVNGGKAN